MSAPGKSLHFPTELAPQNRQDLDCIVDKLGIAGESCP